jgi:cyclic dehypoxanthinyl futalosine synthase
MLANRRHNRIDVLERAVTGKRLMPTEILALYDYPSSALRKAAHEVRLRCSDPEVATYSIGGNIDYTNVCVVACKFCVFYRAKHQEGAFTLNFDEIARQMDQIRAIGGREILMQGGVNPDLPFSWYVELFKFLKKSYPDVHIDALSPEEVLGLEKLTGRDAFHLLAELHEAGMDGMPGSAAEILVEEVRRQIAPTRITRDDWFRIVDAAQRLGIYIAWVPMVIGFGETQAHRVEHLLALREQQDKALDRYGNGFGAFKVWPARVEQSRLNGRVPAAQADETVNEYLRHVAIARLALNNVANHRAVWRTMGFGVASEALRSGANDLCGTGSINAINAVITASGKQLPDLTQTLLRQVEGCIADAGFIPALRDARYNILERRRAKPAA